MLIGRISRNRKPPYISASKTHRLQQEKETYDPAADRARDGFDPSMRRTGGGVTTARLPAVGSPRRWATVLALDAERLLRDGAAEMVVPRRFVVIGRLIICTVRDSRLFFSAAYRSCRFLRAFSNRARSAPIQTPSQSISVSLSLSRVSCEPYRSRPARAAPRCCFSHYSSLSPTWRACRHRPRRPVPSTCR
jgi:hypothetical protein